MKTNLIPEIRLFVASTQEVKTEKDRLQSIVDRLNKNEPVKIKLLDWRQDSIPRVGQRPQKEISDQLGLKDTDIVILILWKNFGSPTGKINPETQQEYTGIEEEFVEAYNAFEKVGKPQIMLFKCTRKFGPDQADPEQLIKIKKFTRDFHLLGLYQEYDKVADFEKKATLALKDFIGKVSLETNSASSKLFLSPIRSEDQDTTHFADKIPTEALINDLSEELVNRFLQESGSSFSLPDDKEKVYSYLRKHELITEGERLTFAGSILFHQANEKPRKPNTQILIFDSRPRHIPPRFTEPPPVYDAYLRIKEYFEATNVITANDVGPYPQEAIIEALANFVVHRNYLSDKKARVNITEESVRFENPGCSLTSSDWIEEALNHRCPIPYPHQKRRNEQLFNAFRLIGIVQEQAKGIVRIKQAVEKHGCFGFDWKNDEKNDLFTLTIYRKSPSNQKHFTSNKFSQKEKDLESKNKGLLEQKGLYEEQKQTLEKQINALSQELTDKEAIIHDLTKTTRKPTNQSEQLQKEQVQESENNQLIKQQDLYEEQKQILEQQINVLKQELIDKDTIIDDLTRTAQKLNNELESRIQKLKSIESLLLTSKNQNEDLNKAIVIYKEKINSLDKKVEDLKEELDKNQGDVRNLQNDLALSQKDFNLATESIKILNEAQQNLKLQITSLNKELTEKKEYIERLTKQISQLTDELDSFQNQIKVKESLLKKISSFEKEKKYLVDRLDHVTEQYAFSQEKLNSLQKYQKVIASVLYICMIIFGILIGSFTFNLVTNKKSLQIEITTLKDNSHNCQANESWTITLVIQSSGGKLPIDYYWASQRVTTSTKREFVKFPFELEEGVDLKGTIFLVSADGQVVAEDIIVPAPLCSQE